MTPEMTSFLPLAAVAVPLVVALGVALTGRWPNIREAITLVGSVATAGIVLSMLPAALAGEAPSTPLLALLPGVELGLRADGLGMAFATVAAVLWVLASVYSIGYMRGEKAKKQTRFYASFAACLATAFGLAFSADLLTFFLFYELLTIATYPLVVHKETPEALAAGRKYLGYLLTGGVALLLAVVIVYGATGTLEFAAGGFAAEALGDAGVIGVFALMALGFGSKAAVMPLHSWLPSAMVAPTPVSALLHAVAVVKAGVFGFARAIGYVLGPEPLADIGATTVLAVLAAVTVLVGSLVAIVQDNLKRRLAFSTIAHLSYIVLGLSILSVAAWDGALLHIINHAVLKITLFFAAGAIYVHAHLDKVSQLDGLGRVMPVTMGAFGVASLGLAGVPPMGGFVSKMQLVLGSVDAGQAAFGAVLLLSGLLAAGYLFPIVYRAFLVAPAAELPVQREATPFMVVPLAVTAGLGLLLGLGDLSGLGAIADSVAAAVVEVDGEAVTAGAGR